MDPYEIIAAPFQLYLAPVGTAFPLIDAAPAGTWVLVGTNGNKNIGEDGVTVTHEDEIEPIRMLGETGPVKASRTSEGLMISLSLHDITLEQYKAALNFNAVTDVAAGAGTAGYRHAGLYKGNEVATRALLLRGPSPYGAGWNLQYEVPRVYQGGSPAPVYAKGAPAGLALEFIALVDLDAASDAVKFGRMVAQDAAPA